ncbi:MAG: hypothetical protein U0271_21460 [Polyangiaceae bacterium]
MPALSEYSNVYNTALLVLRAKGFQLWYDEKQARYWAEKDGWDFSADSPCALLGLVAILEFTAPSEFREYWWRLRGEDLYGNLPTEPVDYTPVFTRVR